MRVGSYIHVPYITERRPYMSTHPVFFAGHTGHEFAEMCPLTRDFSITRRVPGIRRSSLKCEKFTDDGRQVMAIGELIKG